MFARAVELFAATALLLLAQSDASNILLYPVAHGFYSSRLKDMVNYASMFIDRGHSVSVLINSVDKRHFDPVEGVHRFLQYPAPEMDVDSDFDSEAIALLQPGWEGVRCYLRRQRKLQSSYCHSLFSQTALLLEIREARFDLLVSDVILDCARLLLLHVKLPSVLYSSHGTYPDPLFFPNLPALVPAPTFGREQLASFGGRLVNTAVHAAIDLAATGPRQALVDALKPLGFRFSVADLTPPFLESLVVVICDPALLDPPRPFFANVKCLAGLNNVPAAPLHPEWEAFVEGSGDAGVVVVSFGTFIRKVPDAAVDKLARALARLPQRVVWKLADKTVKDPGPNLRVRDWIPQNDLLGHEKTRLFVTHCGSHGSYEAVSPFSRTRAHEGSAFTRLANVRTAAFFLASTAGGGGGGVTSGFEMTRMILTSCQTFSAQMKPTVFCS